MTNIQELFASIRDIKDISSLDAMDAEIFKIIKAAKADKISSPLFLNLVVRRAILAMNRHYCDKRLFSNMRFSAHEYFLTFGVEIEVKKKDSTKTVNIRRYLTDSDFWTCVRTFQFYMEEKRIQAGCLVENFEMRT